MVSTKVVIIKILAENSSAVFKKRLAVDLVLCLQVVKVASHLAPIFSY